jgi:hypothetical protein
MDGPVKFTAVLFGREYAKTTSFRPWLPACLQRGYRPDTGNPAKTGRTTPFAIAK